MFADLIGSTALSAALDAEDLGELMLRYLDETRRIVESYGGHVAQFQGDGVLAYFGYPTSDEYACERAVRAGLAVVANLNAINDDIGHRMHVSLGVRIGIDVGPVVLAAQDDAPGPAVHAFGEAVNIAARLQAVAEPGSVVISDAVRRLAGASVQARDLGRLELKGVTGRVRGWAVHHLVAHQQRAREHATLVGRDEELQRLLALWSAAFTGVAQVALVEGEPGIGKTALLRELRSTLRDQDVLWVELRCSPFAVGKPLHPVIELLDAFLGALDDTPTRLARLRMLVDRSFHGDACAVALLGRLVGMTTEDDDTLPTDPELVRHRTLDALARAIVNAARQRPCVVHLDDAHWSDPSTLELLWRAVAMASRSRMLFVLAFRPDADVTPPPAASAVRLRLDRLAPEAAEELAVAVADDVGVPAAVAMRLAERADGVPLFIEELVFDAAETSDPGDDVPATLDGLLIGRLDRLGDAKRVAQAASTIGRLFSRELLAAVTEMPDEALDTALDRLVSAGLVSRLETPDWPAYVFRHALVQQAAYESLLNRDRRRLHERIATVLRARDESGLAVDPAVVAHHLAESDSAIEAARWWSRAAEDAAARAGVAEAALHLQRGIAVLDGQPDSDERAAAEMTLQVQLANVSMALYGMGSDALPPMWQRAITLAERLGDAEHLTAALNGQAAYHLENGDLAAATTLAERILDIAAEKDLRLARVRGHGTIALARFFQADGRAALRHLDQAIADHDPADFAGAGDVYLHFRAQAVASRASAAAVAMWVGDAERALAEATAALELARSLSTTLGVVFAAIALADVHRQRGEPHLALDATDIARSAADALHHPFGQSVAGLIAGAARVSLGDRGGLADIDEALASLASFGSANAAGLGFCILAESKLLAGQPEQAVATADLGLSIGAQTNRPAYDAELLRLKAAALPADAGAESERLLRRAVDIARTQGAGLFHLRAATDLATLLHRRGDGAEAGSLLDEVLAGWPADTTVSDAVRARRLAQTLTDAVR